MHLIYYLPYRQESAESRIATIVIRGSTDNYMDDIERAVDDAVNTFKGLCRVWILSKNFKTFLKYSC